MLGHSANFPLCFNPRSREGSDDDVSLLAGSLDVSIHAPAKGATYYYRITAREFGVSIHAPAKGATTCCNKAPLASGVSIHAPAKGATHWF